MSAIIGSIVGFLGSAVTPIAEHFTKKQDYKFQLQKMDKQAELIAKGYTHEMRMFEQQAYDNEHERLIEHDIQISKHTGFIGALQRSVRPVITYSFFLLFALVEISILYKAISMDMPLTEAIVIVWDEDTKAVWAAIISFWFGNRAMEKAKNRLKPQ